jgi:hypothetical protein
MAIQGKFLVKALKSFGSCSKERCSGAHHAGLLTNAPRIAWHDLWGKARQGSFKAIFI